MNGVVGSAKRYPCKQCTIMCNYKAIYCSIGCQQQYQYEQYIQRWRAGLETGVVGITTKATSGHLRRYIREKYNSSCTKCGWDEINPYSNTVPVEIDHIDGNHLNNKEDNLTLLCPNCHSLTSTFRNLNKGKGRHFRRKSIDSDAPDL